MAGADAGKGHRHQPVEESIPSPHPGSAARGLDGLCLLIPVIRSLTMHLCGETSAGWWACLVRPWCARRAKRFRLGRGGGALRQPPLLHDAAKAVDRALRRR